ncbi:excisionase family DNA binding protein [Sinorhizobium kostiense]|uniref:Excisionase family DNA binding protein n=1 Tax=Sinorhizobium kostiense TaxID=76747 RepID=A0ABS4R6U8_9HYPH|nr:helix-turn-helix domain-containing protein [Sinorhizobium kostiense]MBP2238621.1 excisionase family DNA binding protein [Sinorhizobium kostiense]
MPQDRYQTVQEFAERLKVSEATERHWIKEGALRAIDIGKGWRISDADLDEFLRQHEMRPRSTLPVEINPADHSDRRER